MKWGQATTREADASASASHDHFTKQYDAQYDVLKPNEKA